MRTSIAHVLTAALLGAAWLATAPVKSMQTSEPPRGFTSIFNGKDLTGWRGRQPDYSPHEQARLTPADLEAKQAAWDVERDRHWRVDVAKGELVSDGQGPHLATEKTYGDFEMYIDWLMVSPNGDSGIYLRSYPQVQIWDPANPREQRNGANRGSGALWNNNPNNPGRWPLAKADRPVGQWNTIRVRMIDDRVWVYLNGQETVDGQVLDNYFNRTMPILDTGPIELQTHGSEMRFRNIFLREILTP